MSHPTPREVVTRYLDVLYNQRRLDLIPELIADPTWRHHAGEVKELAMPDTIERLEATLELCPELHFDVALLHEGGDMITVAWNGRSTQVSGKSYVYCGIEIFRVVEGKIVEIWNSRETSGHWYPPVTDRLSPPDVQGISSSRAGHRNQPSAPGRLVGPPSSMARSIDPGRLTIDMRRAAVDWSSDTWIVTTIGRTCAQPRVVVRLEAAAGHVAVPDLRPAGARSSVSRRAPGEHPEIPTPRVISTDLDGRRGSARPAFIMDHVDGRVPRDDQPDLRGSEAGCSRPTTDSATRTFHTSLLDALVAIHAVGLDQSSDERRACEAPPTAISWPLSPSSSTSGTFDPGSALGSPSIVDGLDTIALLSEDVPHPTSDCLLWGDARPANVVTDAGDVHGRPHSSTGSWRPIGSPERDLDVADGDELDEDTGLPDSRATSRIPHRRGVRRATMPKHTGRELRRLDWYRRLRRHPGGRDHAPLPSRARSTQDVLDEAHRVVGDNRHDPATPRHCKFVDSCPERRHQLDRCSDPR